MNELIDNIFNSLLGRGVDPRIIVIVIAILPIAEARLAIPIALKCGLSPLEALLYGFIGSSLCVPLLLVGLIPLIKFLSSTKLFKKIGESLLNRFSKKAEGISGNSALRRMIGTTLFVAVPLPLTGVWTGSAVASILGIGFIRAFASVLIGNLIASTLVLIITLTFAEYINIIMAAFAFIALIAAITLLIRTIRPKRIG